MYLLIQTLQDIAMSRLEIAILLDFSAGRGILSFAQQCRVFFTVFALRSLEIVKKYKPNADYYARIDSNAKWTTTKMCCAEKCQCDVGVNICAMFLFPVFVTVKQCHALHCQYLLCASVLFFLHLFLEQGHSICIMASFLVFWVFMHFFVHVSNARYAC